MLAQADFQRTLALALGELAPGWAIVGECAPVDRLDASHWGSGPQSFQVTFRHRLTGDLKVLGRRVAYEPGASVHPAIALPLIGAYRHGNPEPLRAYLEEIGVAAAAPSDAGHLYRLSGAEPGTRRPDPADLPARSVAVAASIAAPSAASAVGEVVTDAEAEDQAQPVRPWSLSIRKSRSPALPLEPASTSRQALSPVQPALTRHANASAPTAEARRPVFGRLRRELEIWYWRRGAHGQDKPHARD